MDVVGMCDDPEESVDEDAENYNKITFKNLLVLPIGIPKTVRYPLSHTIRKRVGIL